MSDSPHTIPGGVAVDDRGSVRFVNDFDFKNVKRFYQVQNHRSGFIRAWHGHQHEAKFVYVASGSALIGAANMGTQVVEKFILSSQSPKVLFIPAGYANGFKTLEENTIILFFSTSDLNSSLNDDIRFDYDKWNIWEEDYR
jgi:dTDP-4-dehydrorhamnose 3,5-epimerase-like enzyme